MTRLETALELAQQGYYIFPVKPNQKTPAFSGWQSQATKKPEKIKQWWGITDYNIGIYTAKFNGSQALVVVDIDNNEKKKGSEELLRLELEGFDFTETASQQTPGGGTHLIYRAPKAVKQGTNVLARGLDIRSKGGYIVGPGSEIDGKKYEWVTQSEPHECPEWIIHRCGQGKEKLKGEDKASASAHDRAIEYLTTKAPVAIQGDSGDQTTYQVAAHLKNLGCGVDQTLELLIDHWNEECEPPWEFDELKKKVHNAFNYSQDPQGSLAPETSFEKLEVKEDGSYLDKINKSFALIFEDGGHSILHETVREDGEPCVKLLSEASFKRMLSPYTVTVGKRTMTYATAWLDWSKRRTFAGLCFKPEQSANHNYYNLWKGFSVKGKPYGEASPQARMGFDMFKEHVYQNLAMSVEKDFMWIMGYFAHLIQRPFEKPRTTVVFKGKKGVGKNIVLELIGQLIKGHYQVTSNSRYLTSNFNGHFKNCLCLVLDEAFWSGDKSAEGQLKSLTTDENILIEMKGKEPFNIKNYVRIFILGNEDWVVPASADERRYAIFEVGEGRMQDQEYFSKMKYLMDSCGGIEVLFDYLQNFDLSKVKINTIPNTGGLLDQKIQSLGPLESFWHEALCEGHFPYLNNEWESRVSKDAFKNAFNLYCKSRSITTKFLPGSVKMAKVVRMLCPSVDTRSKTLASDSTYSARDAAFALPSLKIARSEFEEYIGHDMPWPLTDKVD